MTRTKGTKPRKTAAERREAKALRLAKAATPEAKKAAAKARESRLKTVFNICSEEYEKVLEFQGGVCAITGKPPGSSALHVDHCHHSGKLRGLLNPWANKGLSFFQDDPVLLRAAASYLENPPVSEALGETVYGVVGKSTKKAKRRLYGPLKTPAPAPRLPTSLFAEKYAAKKPKPTTLQDKLSTLPINRRQKIEKRVATLIAEPVLKKKITVLKPKTKTKKMDDA